MTRLRDAVLLLLGVALALRVAAWLLWPALPLLLVACVLAVIYRLLFVGRR